LPPLGTVGHMRPHYEDVRPQSEDAPAISQPLRDIAPPIYRWKGNGVTFQMSHQGVQTKKVFMVFARAELFNRSRRPSDRATQPPPMRACRRPQALAIPAKATGTLLPTMPTRRRAHPIASLVHGPCAQTQLNLDFTDGRNLGKMILLRCLTSEMLTNIDS
jgi:hypothetical protein